MSISLAPYLNFPQGVTREAMTFYQSVFGGKLDITTFGDFNMPGMPADGVMHAMLATESFTFMASDAMPGSENQWGGTRVYLTFFGDDLVALTGWFNQLSDGGSVGSPLEKMAWGDTYGVLKDKYGLEWMFNIGGQNAASAS
jgi:PhnB protein